MLKGINDGYILWKSSAYRLLDTPGHEFMHVLTCLPTLIIFFWNWFSILTFSCHFHDCSRKKLFSACRKMSIIKGQKEKKNLLLIVSWFRPYPILTLMHLKLLFLQNDFHSLSISPKFYCWKIMHFIYFMRAIYAGCYVHKEQHIFNTLSIILYNVFGGLLYLL